MTSASNPYFNNFTHPGEQNLIESLIVESIGIYGHRVKYLPRTLGAKDEVYGEDALSIYDQAIDIDLYIRSFDSYEGDGSFLSKFNLEIRDQTTFTMARRTFANTVAPLTDAVRPLEGDLIYSAMMDRLFIIKYVNNTTIFYQMGSLQVWDLVTEVFEYSNERFNTGIPAIDNIETEYSAALTTSNSEFDAVMNDVFATNEEFQQKGSGLLDWEEVDPFSDGSI